jgi:hypothetical protein
VVKLDANRSRQKISPARREPGQVSMGGTLAADHYYL